MVAMARRQLLALASGLRRRAPRAAGDGYKDEPRLMLLREWSLFDSMLCSSYVATKLKTWSDNGLKKLKLLLATMGFPLADCQKNFQYMSMEVKRKMRDEFDRFLPEYGLTEFYYRSFLRVHGKDLEGKRKRQDLPDGSGWGDHIQLLQIFGSWDQTDYDPKWCSDHDLQVRGMKFSKNVRNQLCQVIQKIAKG